MSIDLNKSGITQSFIEFKKKVVMFRTRFAQTKNIKY